MQNKVSTLFLVSNLVSLNSVAQGNIDMSTRQNRWLDIDAANTASKKPNTFFKLYFHTT